MATSSVFMVTLERDGHDQPWGFRLQGGTDVALPLTVQRVLVGTPAESALIRGDIITKISCTETKNITHQQAADLFANGGNQIEVFVKRPVAVVPSTPPLPNGVPEPLPNPKEQAQQAAQEAAKAAEEPYRTVPLVQPSAKAYQDLGVGSINHLKMQDEHISGEKQPAFIPSLAEAARAKGDEIVMKQKVTGSLAHLTQQTQNTVNTVAQAQRVVKQANSPQALYSAENVAEVARNPLLLSPTHIPIINPKNLSAPAPVRKISVNKPQKGLGLRGMRPGYDPEQSATWQIIHEQENCQLVTEHGPTESKVYSI